MAAPTNVAGVKKALANPEPSTHGLQLKTHVPAVVSAFWREAIITLCSSAHVAEYHCQGRAAPT